MGKKQDRMQGSEPCEKRVPLRMCIACGQRKTKAELLRIVKNQQGDILLHLEGHQEGRGLYLCKDPACLQKLPKCGKRVYKSYKEMLPPIVASEVMQWKP